MRHDMKNGVVSNVSKGAEATRLTEDRDRVRNWKRWGPYISERQWGTVREDYSPWGDCWNSFPHDHARSRAYRWGEDGLLGITDRQCRLCFALALWNGNDPILKERIFGLTNPEGNHGEDVKELYYYLDSTPTHSYMKALYKYPQAAFPYEQILRENRQRGPHDREFELMDSGVFSDNRYFDVFAEYAKNGPDDILMQVTVANRGPERATLHLLPTLWFRNTWSWGGVSEDLPHRPKMSAMKSGDVRAEHETLGTMLLLSDPANGTREAVFTENDTNSERLFGSANATPYVKDAFHEYVVHGRKGAVNPNKTGTKAAFVYQLNLQPGEERVLRFRLVDEKVAPAKAFGPDFASIYAARLQEADEFYAEHIPAALSDEERNVMRQSYAGLLWSKQFYYYDVSTWLKGDPNQPAPPEARQHGRNSDWEHLYNRDIISMPDKWEYPWYAAWDLAFHMIPFARIDPDFAKDQLALFLREWYMHPNGQIPAYEFAFGDVNPPVHAWACWRVYKMTAKRGQRDRQFLARVFQKLLLNFTWWVNRKDPDGKHVFAGGFLGLDNIGVFDRSQPLPTGGHLEQADGTAWMAFYCGTMLAMALELASEDPVYEDVASKFFEHFIAIADAMNTLGGTGLWDDADGFYYDQIHVDGRNIPLRMRSLVGLIPLFASEILEDDVIARLPGFAKRMNWFVEHRGDLARHIAYLDTNIGDDLHSHRLLAIPSRPRLERLLSYLLDETEFLSPYGIRAVSRKLADNPYIFKADGMEYRVAYEPGESTSGLFGGNSNWRGPIWFPVNYLIVEALERFGHFYGDTLRVECPTGSGVHMTLYEVANELRRRLSNIFLPGDDGHRPCHDRQDQYAHDDAWKNLVLFHEYFHGETGRGIGANHQAGWTALVSECLRDLGKEATRKSASFPTHEHGTGVGHTHDETRKKSVRV